MFVRPVAMSDIPALEELATLTPGVHTLPRKRETIAEAIERSIASFAASPDMPSEESYFFVLEADDGQIAGTATISGTAGLGGTFFAFRNDVLDQVSRELNISHSVHVLSMCSDLTDCSQLSGFYVQEQYRTESEATLLSRSRLLLAAVAPQRFSEKFFSSMSGITDANGRSPFWDAIGRKFFHMDFLEAERMIEGARNRTLIVEMMPPYPVYVPLLPEDAQAVMGQLHAQAELPFRILSEEGFEPDEYLDIFDGGPILRAHRNDLRCFSRSMRRTAASHSVDSGALTANYLVATAREENFRALVVECPAPELSQSVLLSSDAMRHLDVVSGDAVLCVKM